MKKLLTALGAAVLTLSASSCVSYNKMPKEKNMSPNEQLIFTMMKANEYLTENLPKAANANNHILVAGTKYKELRPYISCHGEPPECTSKYVYNGMADIMGHEYLADKLVLSSSDKLACYFLYSVACYNIKNLSSVNSRNPDYNANLFQYIGNVTPSTNSFYKIGFSALKKCAAMGIGRNLFTSYVNHKEEYMKMWKESLGFKDIDATVDKKFKSYRNKINNKELLLAKKYCSGVTIPKKINQIIFSKIDTLAFADAPRYSSYCAKWSSFMTVPEKCEWQRDYIYYYKSSWSKENSEISEYNIPISPENTPIIALETCKFYKKIENR